VDKVIIFVFENFVKVRLKKGFTFQVCTLILQPENKAFFCTTSNAITLRKKSEDKRLDASG